MHDDVELDMGGVVFAVDQFVKPLRVLLFVLRYFQEDLRYLLIASLLRLARKESVTGASHSLAVQRRPIFFSVREPQRERAFTERAIQ
jgi:hypothetical protein